ncbi:hypothetical protein DSM106972_048080 [Dulcicalothrix desertica PCC 7102]|uniref:Uncharacterized protein n=1 Tax=Dulcicalothrix desertica PCC 7102 TaxID=232991 RepID=A0A3S1ALG6_9CYAN|nr:hypothetical protein DSM106972_048080 [Dulcicalothrix desertica PCC 7102]
MRVALQAFIYPIGLRCPGVGSSTSGKITGTHKMHHSDGVIGFKSSKNIFLLLGLFRVDIDINFSSQRGIFIVCCDFLSVSISSLVIFLYYGFKKGSFLVFNKTSRLMERLADFSSTVSAETVERSASKPVLLSLQKFLKQQPQLHVRDMN